MIPIIHRGFAYCLETCLVMCLVRSPEKHALHVIGKKLHALTTFVSKNVVQKEISQVKKHIILTLTPVLAGTMFFIAFAGTTAVDASASSGEENMPVATVQAVVTEEKPSPAENEDKKESVEPVQAIADENTGKTQENTNADAGKEPRDKDADKKDVKKAEAANVAVIDGLVLSDAERRVYDLTNAERRKRGLPALRLERRLMESARRQANWMARTGIFQHGHSGFAENIAMGQRSSLDVVIAWMNSSGHRRNMLNSGHGAIGIGAFQGRNGALYWCQQFSR